VDRLCVCISHKLLDGFASSCDLMSGDTKFPGWISLSDKHKSNSMWIGLWSLKLITYNNKWMNFLQAVWNYWTFAVSFTQVVYCPPSMHGSSFYRHASGLCCSVLLLFNICTADKTNVYSLWSSSNTRTLYLHLATSEMWCWSGWRGILRELTMVQAVLTGRLTG